MFDERFVGTDQEVGGEVEVVGDGAVDGAAADGVVRRLGRITGDPRSQGARCLGNRAKSAERKASGLVHA